jgi:hypothetical protein
MHYLAITEVFRYVLELDHKQVSMNWLEEIELRNVVIQRFSSMNLSIISACRTSAWSVTP